MQKHIYLIRHGETDFNRKGIVQGRGVDSDLNENGKTQAQLFFKAYRHIGFDAIYISNLKRTFQTIEPFARLQIPVIKHAGLDEISWGVHEGQKDGESFKRFYEILHLWKQGKTEQCIEGGESPHEVQSRQISFIDDLQKVNAEKILICSHGRAMRILLCTMLNRHLREMDNFPHKNLSLYKLNYNSGAFEVELFNETKHVAATL